MTDYVQLKHLKSFIPFQHHLQIYADPLYKKNVVDQIFTNQESNLKHILSNTLDLAEIRKIQGLDYLPEETKSKLFSNVAQIQLDKGLADLKEQKFSKEYDSIPDDPSL